MLDPYENILIGNFLYSLGLQLGAKSVQLRKSIGGSVNLLQQTPLDGPLADVYLAYPGVVRILEFKRKSNPSPKETSKFEALQARLASSDNRDLVPVSRAIHWYVESRKASPVWITRARPYLDFKAASDTDIDVMTLCKQIVRNVLGADAIEFPDSLIKRYFVELARYAGTTGTSSSALVVMTGADGTLRWVAVDSMRELRLDLKLQKVSAESLSRAVDEQRIKEAAEEQKRQLEQLREQSKKKSRGQDYSP